MISEIKIFYKRHKYYPNKSELARLLNVDRRTVASNLKELETTGIIKKVKSKQIVCGDYELINN